MGAGPEALIPTPISKETMMSEYLDEINEADQDLFVVASTLRYLSNSFYQTGNTILGNKMSEYADRIDAANKRIRTAVAKELNRSVAQAQENSATLMKGVMAGIHLGRDENEADPLDGD